MIIPSGLIFLPLLIAFLMLCYQYYRQDTEIRVRNLRFALMASGVVLMIAYLVLSSGSVYPGVVSPVFLVLAIGLLATSVRLLWRMKPGRS